MPSSAHAITVIQNWARQFGSNTCNTLRVFKVQMVAWLEAMWYERLYQKSQDDVRQHLAVIGVRQL